MNDLLRNLKISINESIYLKDPESSDLGKRIVEHGILLINELGFDNFTFKKLGERIESNESSIYRYFENKHKFLIYLTSWYWGWKEYQLAFATININDPKHKLNQAIEILTREVEEDQSFNHINEVALNKIVINEYSKSYLTKEVDDENKEGYFVIYKRLSNRLKEMIADVNEGYPYPASLASTILAGSLHQHFLKDHFTSLTDCGAETSPSQYFIHLTSNLLNS
ncbi:TetR/AcrR family transcriptional regulator [Leeuwenhoekiella marinoflava]|uniref:TetR family transcriptional regulator n=2 Tax=Leeuwenhoekiella marinoflava TaxID=988 RepID=A0A4Q0PK88_9FLAO|nr:TetR/AcrR family transcriptional regulator [Leeuwenhoekiella marinoflava]RXG28321.1 TetR family transcriptional regulator [Leeuwenhoekiella marinoflava]SHF56325.1 transcriptional regulator, TetR family [Leeuwenhoekiella marinoflava DSM 3653]